MISHFPTMVGFIPNVCQNWCQRGACSWCWALIVPSQRYKPWGFRVAVIHPAFHGRCFEVLTTLWIWHKTETRKSIDALSQLTQGKQNGFIFTEVSCILWQVNSTSSTRLQYFSMATDPVWTAWSQEDTPRIHPKTLPRSQGRPPHFLQGHKHIDTCTIEKATTLKGKNLQAGACITLILTITFSYFHITSPPVTASPADSGQCRSLPWCQLSNFIVQTHQGKKYHLSFLELTFFHILWGDGNSTMFLF